MSIANSQTYHLPLIKKEKIAQNTWSFYFSRQNYPDFFPGQYNIVTLGLGLSREFTISSSPTQKDYLSITTKINEQHSDFKDALLEIKEGSMVEFDGPKGGFYLRTDDKTPRVFMSGGIGITPFHSIIKFVADKKIDIPISLLASFSLIEEIVFEDELSLIVQNHKQLKVIFTLQHITSNLIQDHISDFRTPIFMVSGPPEMVENIITILRTLGVQEENIKTDLFTGY